MSILELNGNKTTTARIGSSKAVSVKNARGEYRQINKHSLHIDESYQRSAAQRRVKDMARQWSWLACGAISVAERNGIYYVIDGQHRVLAARNNEDIDTLPCFVFPSDSSSGEARGFLDINVGRGNVDAMSKYKASLVAKDPRALQINALMTSLGIHFKIGSTPRVKETGCIGFITAIGCSNIEDISIVLRVAEQLATAAEIGISEYLLRGLLHIHRNFEGGLNDRRLVDRLKSKGATLLLKTAKSSAAYLGTASGSALAEGMMREINKKMQNKFVLTANS